MPLLPARSLPSLTGPSPVLARAAWVAPMDGPPIRDGAVVVQHGRIVDVGDGAAVRARHPTAHLEDLGDVVLLPGLVNAHVHLELTHVPRGGTPPASFVDWLLNVMAKAPPPGEAGEADVAAATRSGVAQCLRFGVTTVGDITRNPAVTRRVLADSPLRAVSFGEVTAMGARRHLLEPRLAAAVAPSPAPDRVVSAVSPHAPYSIEPEGYRRCVAEARAAGVPVATHLAETAEDEWTFLSEHAGPFRRLWDAIGGWDAHIPKLHPVEAGLVGFAQSVGLLGRLAAKGEWQLTDPPGTGDVDAVLAHVNDESAFALAGAQATVVHCPRTHVYFGREPFPLADLLRGGVNVAVGTDSAASSPDLNLVDDLRLLRRLAPDLPPIDLWALATTQGARALGMQDRVGSIAPGKAADLVAFPVSPACADPLAEVLDGSEVPTAVWIGGVRAKTA